MGFRVEKFDLKLEAVYRQQELRQLGHKEIVLFSGTTQQLGKVVPFWTVCYEVPAGRTEPPLVAVEETPLTETEIEEYHRRTGVWE